MGKAVITMTDNGDGIDVKLEFDPPVDGGGQISGAQGVAWEMLKVASKVLEQSGSDVA